MAAGGRPVCLSIWQGAEATWPDPEIWHAGSADAATTRFPEALSTEIVAALFANSSIGTLAPA